MFLFFFTFSAKDATEYIKVFSHAYMLITSYFQTLQSQKTRTNNYK